MVTPEVSILMPAKNAALFVAETLQSVLAQDLKAWELIVVDDFSTDNTVEILERTALADPRIRLYRNKAQGIIPALQLAFDHSKGTYITRMDADDLMPAGKLATLYGASSLQRKTVVTGCVEYFSEATVSEGYRRYEKWLNSLVRQNNFYPSIYRECIIASPNWMVHRSCFENDFLFADLHYPEDYDMVFRWYKSGYRIQGINQITHRWREHENRTSRHDEAYQQESFFRLKTNYFIDLELKKDEKVQLFGASKKGKLVAKILQERKVDFDWFDFGTTEVRQVGTKKVQPVGQLKKQVKSILTAWPAKEQTQAEITAFLDSHEFVFGRNVWLF